MCAAAQLCFLAHLLFEDHQLAADLGGRGMTQLEPSVAEPSSQAIKEHVKAMLRKLLDRLQNDTPAGAAPQAG